MVDQGVWIAYPDYNNKWEYITLSATFLLFFALTTIFFFLNEKKVTRVASSGETNPCYMVSSQRESNPGGHERSYFVGFFNFGLLPLDQHNVGWADFIIGQIELYDSMSNDWSGNVYITTVLQRQKDFT